MGWKAGEREFLIYVTLNGPSDQKTVADSYHLAAPTINLAKDSLVQRGYIALRGKEAEGRGAPRKVYGLTPAGLIAAFHEGDLWGNAGPLTRRWEAVAPVFIKSYKTIWEWGFGEDAKRYCETSLVENKIAIEALGREGEQLESYMPYSFVNLSDLLEQDKPDPWEALLRVIDMGFYAEMHRLYGGDDRDRYLGMVRTDKALLEGWLRWFEWERERFMELEEHRRILANEH